jgi:hypothetical protein
MIINGLIECVIILLDYTERYEGFNGKNFHYGDIVSLHVFAFVAVGMPGTKFSKIYIHTRKKAWHTVKR